MKSVVGSFGIATPNCDKYFPINFTKIATFPTLVAEVQVSPEVEISQQNYFFLLKCSRARAIARRLQKNSWAEYSLVRNRVGLLNYLSTQNGL